MAPGAEGFDPVALAGPPGMRIWWVRLDQPADRVDAMLAVLSTPERRRAEAQPGAAARRRFIVRRAALKGALGAVIGTAPGGLVLGARPDGKPCLVEPGPWSSLEFNLSRAREVAVGVISMDRAVGIDLAWTGGSAPFAPVVGRFFSGSERASLDAAPPEARRAAFLRTWVRKEAYLKGRGAGISEAIYRTRFGGTMSPEGLLSEGAEPWRIHDLDGLPDGYVGSLAVGPAGLAQEPPQARRTGETVNAPSGAAEGNQRLALRH